jgi:hypothetical protein
MRPRGARARVTRRRTGPAPAARQRSRAAGPWGLPLPARGRLLPVALALAAGVLLIAAPATPASASAGASTGKPDAAPAPIAATAVPHGRGGSDWWHACQVVAWLRHRPPPRRVVYLFGGSAARESITTEAAWSRDLRRSIAGKAVAAYVLASKCQTFVEDTHIVKALPGGRGLALITVGLTRFNKYSSPKRLPTGVRTVPPDPWYAHHYDDRPPLSLSQKRAIVHTWVAEHYPLFAHRYPRRLRELDALVDACLAKGIRPVLVESPMNRVAVRHDFSAPRKTCQKACRDLAAEHGIVYLDLTDTFWLPSRDFYDLWHLVPPGRAIWQRKLTTALVAGHLL